jgi:hypothetical protein
MNSGHLTTPCGSAKKSLRRAVGGANHLVPVMNIHPSGGQPGVMDPAPAPYVIRVKGRLGATVLSAFPAMAPHHHGAHTVLTGLLDRSALYGVLAEIDALGLDLVEVRRLPLDPESGRPGSRLTIDEEENHGPFGKRMELSRTNGGAPLRITGFAARAADGGLRSRSAGCGSAGPARPGRSAAWRSRPRGRGRPGRPAPPRPRCGGRRSGRGSGTMSRATPLR